MLELPPPQRLALAYATRATRAAWETLFVLDARLGAVVLGAREPMLAQIRLAWWRERLAQPPADWPSGEPLLSRLAEWGSDPLGRLVELVDGWEGLLGDDPLDASVVESFVGGREQAVAALAAHCGVELAQSAFAARSWAIGDLAARWPGAAVTEAGQALAHGPPRLPRALRPLAVLDVLARGELAGASPLRRMAAAIRVGILGI